MMVLLMGYKPSYMYKNIIKDDAYYRIKKIPKLTNSGKAGSIISPTVLDQKKEGKNSEFG